MRRLKRSILRAQLDFLDDLHAVFALKDRICAARDMQKQRFPLVIG